MDRLHTSPSPPQRFRTTAFAVLASFALLLTITPQASAAGTDGIVLYFHAQFMDEQEGDGAISSQFIERPSDYPEFVIWSIPRDDSIQLAPSGAFTVVLSHRTSLLPVAADFTTRIDIWQLWPDWDEIRIATGTFVSHQPARGGPAVHVEEEGWTTFTLDADTETVAAGTRLRVEVTLLSVSEVPRADFDLEERHGRAVETFADLMPPAPTREVSPVPLPVPLPNIDPRDVVLDFLRAPTGAIRTLDSYVVYGVPTSSWEYDSPSSPSRLIVHTA